MSKVETSFDCALMDCVHAGSVGNADRADAPMARKFNVSARKAETLMSVIVVRILLVLVRQLLVAVLREKEAFAM